MTDITVEEDLDFLVQSFSVALLSKLRLAEAKHGWNGAWKDPARVPLMREALREHVEKGDPIDVAALAAFLWFHGASTVESK